MDPAAFQQSAPGRVLNAPGGYWAFVPHPLPPELSVDWGLTSLIAEASSRLSNLSGLGRSLANPKLILQPFIRREAVLSSRIEGTQSSIADLLLFEAEGKPSTPLEDVQEVHNYVQALEYGLDRLTTLPLSLRLIREIHERLMEGVRGKHATPGEFRKSQNWIGSAGATLENATYVPPPVPEMQEALADLEQFLHADSSLPLVVKLALIHYQFEAIHPFLDGNGRLGRLLITLLLCNDGILEAPLLNLSVYIEQHRPTYYRLLLDVSTKGDWRGWLDFFLTGIAEQSLDALTRANLLIEKQNEYRGWAMQSSSSKMLLAIVEQLFVHPAFRIEQIAQRLEKSPQAIRFQLPRLLDRGILHEKTGRTRDRIYFADELIAIVEG